MYLGYATSIPYQHELYSFSTDMNGHGKFQTISEKQNFCGSMILIVNAHKSSSPFYHFFCFVLNK